MTIFLAEKLGRLVLVTTAAVLVNGLVLQKVPAQEVDLDTLCQKFPLNSRCEGYTPFSQGEKAATAAGPEPQVIKLKLETSGPDNEWIRLEMSGNRVKLLHTTRSNRGFSGLINGALGVVSPVPLPDINFSGWNDHQTTRVVFEPDSCPENLAPERSQPSGSPSCAIEGTDSVFLAEGMDISKGRFTIEYVESDLSRRITFRVPAEDS